MRKVGLSIDELFVKHINSFDHPESPDRVYIINDMLNETGIINNLTILKTRDATKQEICAVHTEKYFNRIASTKGKAKVFLDQDTSTNPFSYDAAVRASGGVLQAIDEIMDKEIDTAFCIERPPGHHAEADRAMGFCLFNHAAVGVGHLLNKGLKKVLIIDWDVHHGNGTQHIFEASNNVLFFSTHQFPFYPGTGAITEHGMDEGKGYTVNVPLSAGMGDKEYIKIFHEILVPAAKQFSPEFIIVSAGFDSYVNDPLGGMNVSADGFSRLTEIVINLSEHLCDGRLLLLLEGGYNLTGLAECTNKVFETLINYESADETNISDTTAADKIIDEVKNNYSGFWTF
ncbi:MAG: histone deacetylase [Candidatus Dadabacteria bacterium]|nr:histone deacetylase [Candidatus Dadabacteria bacterium]NIS07829.1 histone deacetylase [Candidatus Dadabacteria bacterium]NIV42783.1 histone deacetylase [Candidatus Dadabacteria bacterium]NIX14848.1 histone deacetylase [Candidatus Dadabacteria bacterium]NIY21448.1 histone deacetylase [Candidatus Dadabacteria bacterium]